MPTESEIRKRVEKIVGYKLRDRIWERTFESDRVYRDGEDQHIEEMAGIAHDLTLFTNDLIEEDRRSSRQRSTEPRTAVLLPLTGSEQLGDYESRRAEVFSQLLADLAANVPIRVNGRRRESGDTKIAAFRRRYLGSVLEFEEAFNFIESTRNRFEVITPSCPHVIPDRWIGEPTSSRSRTSSDVNLKAIDLPDRDGTISPVTFVEGSALGKLAALAESLSRQYPWSQADAAWFVLTATPPFVFPLSVGSQVQGFGLGYSRALITMQIEPWMPAETVSTAYRSIQQQLLDRPTNRPIRQAAELVLWVQDQRRAAGCRPTWNTLAERRRAEQLPFSDKRNLIRAHREAVETILRFPYLTNIKPFDDDSQIDSQTAGL